MVVHTSNPNTWEEEDGILQDEGQPEYTVFNEKCLKKNHLSLI